MTLVGALLVVAGIAPTALGDVLPDGPLFRIVAVVVGIAGTGFFGLSTVVGMRLAFRADTGLIVDADGFTDTSSYIAAGHVPWNQVTGWNFQEIQGQKNLCILVADNQAVLDRMGPLARLFSRGNIKLVGSPVCIGLNNLSGTPEAIIAAFQERMPTTDGHGAR